MKLLLIAPRSKRGHAFIKSEKMSFNIPPQSLLLLAALTPQDVDVSMVDENVDEINYEMQVDLVGITVLTMTAPRAYEIADQYRMRGVPVVLGGIHPSMMPEEASQHSDAVVIGEAEETWQELIADFRNGNMRKVYHCDTPPNLSGLPIPRRELLKKNAYSTINVIQTTRGCPYNCSFCSVTRFFGHKYRSRPIDEVIKEVENLRGKFIYFAEADLVGNPSYAKKLFERLIPYKKIWISDVGIRIARDEELLKLAAKSGCKIVYIGFESLSPESLQEAGKSQNVVEDYKECIDRIHQFGIAVGGSFMFGFDTDDKSVFERTVEFAIESKLDFADFNNLCPYPGTSLYDKLQREGRILVKDWSKYFAMSNVVFQPKQMSMEDLENGCIWAWKQFYSSRSIFKRFLLRHNFTSWFHPIAYLLINLEGKRGLSKLNKKGRNPSEDYQ